MAQKKVSQTALHVGLDRWWLEVPFWGHPNFVCLLWKNTVLPRVLTEIWAAIPATTDPISHVFI